MAPVVLQDSLTADAKQMNNIVCVAATRQHILANSRCSLLIGSGSWLPMQSISPVFEVPMHANDPNSNIAGFHLGYMQSLLSYEQFA